MSSKIKTPREDPANLPMGHGVAGPRPGALRRRGATAALVGRVLISSSAKYSAGPLDAAAVQRKP